jgi:phosphoribosylanthranilate isomerase
MIVKICGITRPEDIEICAEAGVDWLGINLWSGSRRHVSGPRAAALAAATRAAGMSPVALVVEASADEIARVWAEGCWDRLQIYGSPAGLPAGLPWIRPLKVQGALPDLAAPTAAGWDLVEADVPGHGGAGRRFDWSLLAGAAFVRPTLIAGGLGPENVAELLGVVQPWGIDLASGVEASPGVKDRAKVRTLMETVRAHRKDPS